MEATLSIWSNYYPELSPEDAVREFKRHGIFASELAYEHGKALLERDPKNPAATGRAFAAFLKSEGFTMTQGHLPLDIPLVTGDGYRDQLPFIDLYEAIGIVNMVLHVDFVNGNHDMSVKERLDANLPPLRAIADYVKGRNICICLENLIRSAPSSDDLLYLIREVGSDRFGICLDTGHLNLTAVEPQEHFIRQAGKYLRALHIADNEGKGSGDQHMMPFGRGNIDYGKVVSALREIDYHGMFNYEIPGETPHAPFEVRGYKLEYIVKTYEWLMRE